MTVTDPGPGIGTDAGPGVPAPVQVPLGGLAAPGPGLSVLLQSQRLEVLDELAGRIRHDLDNALMALLGRVEILLDEVTTDSPVREELAHVVGVAMRISHLVRQFLDFSRRVQAPVTVDLRAVVRAIEPTLRRLLDEGVGLDVRTPGPAAAVHADRATLEQVVVSLVGTVRLAPPATISVEARRRADHVELTVSSAEASRAQAPGAGAGLNLDLVSAVVAQMGGAVYVGNGPEPSVTVRLPCVADR